MSCEPLFDGKSQTPTFANAGQTGNSFDAFGVGQFWFGLERMLAEPVRPQRAGCERAQPDFLRAAIAAIKAFLSNRLERSKILFC